MAINGQTRLLAHIGYPTDTFTAPMIYNPYFESRAINAVVVPMGVKAEDFAASFKAIFRMTNVHGALITMPHKVTALSHVDAVSTTARIAGSCNAVIRRADGALLADMFDGEGFVRGVARSKRRVDGRSALVVGAGGAGSAIAASLAAASIGRLGLYDTNRESAESLARRLAEVYPDLVFDVGSNDPTGFDIVVNATPLGMRQDDPLPISIARIAPSTLVCDVVLTKELSPLLRAARAKGCAIQAGREMLFEQIPAYLEFFGFGTTTSDTLRSLAKIDT